MGESVLPGESEIGLILIAALAVAVLVVLDVLTSSVPAKVLFLRLFLGVDDDLHAHLVEVVEFVLVEYFELDFEVFGGVGSFEKEPLRIAVRIDIILEQQVVFKVCYF